MWRYWGFCWMPPSVCLLWLVKTWMFPSSLSSDHFSVTAPNNWSLSGLVESLLKSVKVSIQLKVQANPYPDFWTFFSTLFPHLWHSVCKFEFNLPEFQISNALVQRPLCFPWIPSPCTSLKNISRSKAGMLKRLTLLTSLLSGMKTLCICCTMSEN